jgi:hypothetical protein
MGGVATEAVGAANSAGCMCRSCIGTKTLAAAQPAQLLEFAQVSQLGNYTTCGALQLFVIFLKKATINFKRLIDNYT